MSPWLFPPLAAANGLIPAFNNYDFNFLFTVAQYDLYDATDRAIFLVGMSWQARLSTSRSVIGGIAGIVILLFLLEYFFYFRPLMAMLRNESQHTLVMLQMIPKNYLRSIKQIRETLEVNNLL